MTDEEIRVIIEQRLEDRGISSKLEMYEHLCLACEEKPVALRRRKFCSDKCANVKRIERKRISRHGVAVRICTYCNEKPLGYGKQKYCGDKCAKLAMLRQQREAWPTWKLENMKKHNASTWTEWIESRRIPSRNSGKSAPRLPKPENLHMEQRRHRFGEMRI